MTPTEPIPTSLPAADTDVTEPQGYANPGSPQGPPPARTGTMVWGLKITLWWYALTSALSSCSTTTVTLSDRTSECFL